MFHRLFTGRRDVKKPEFDESTRHKKVLEDVEERVHRLEIAAKRDREAVELLEMSFKKLRGRLTGGLRNGEDPQNVIPFGDKEALRAHALKNGLLKPQRE